ncbi:MAG: helix-turn-helix domain-containing protein [Cyanobacteria bacterium P01_A01_bin.114]
MEAMTTNVLELQKSWSTLEPLLAIQNEEDYIQSVKQLNYLIDAIGTDDQHPLYSLLDTLGILIEVYEEEHVAIPDVSGVEVLKYFMEEHSLTQTDLPELGSQGVVSELLSGKRELNLRQIQALSQRFHVSPAVFI